MKKEPIEKESLGNFQGHQQGGIIGDWKNHFIDDMKIVFLRKYERELDGCGLIYDFGEGKIIICDLQSTISL